MAEVNSTVDLTLNKNICVDFDYSLISMLLKLMKFPSKVDLKQGNIDFPDLRPENNNFGKITKVKYW